MDETSSGTGQLTTKRIGLFVAEFYEWARASTGLPFSTTATGTDEIWEWGVCSGEKIHSTPHNTPLITDIRRYRGSSSSIQAI